MLKYSASFATEQLHSLTATLSKTMQKLRASRPNYPSPGTFHGTRFGARLTAGSRISSSPKWSGITWNSAEALAVEFQVDHKALQRLRSQRFGRTLLLTNRLDWTAEQVVAGYSGQQQIEQGFRGLKRRRLAGMGADVSLDRQQDPRSRFLLHARHFAAAIYSPPGKLNGLAGSTIEHLLEQLSKSSSSPCSIHHSATRDRIVWPLCFPSRHWLNKLLPIHSACNSSVVPNVGNTGLFR